MLGMWFFAVTQKAWLFLRGVLRALLGPRRLNRWLEQSGLRRLKARYWRFKTVLADGNRLVYRPHDQCVIDEIYIRKIYTTGTNILPGQTVVDIGGHIGIFTLYAARKVGPQGRVIVCEPSPDNLELLRRNIALNGYRHVTVYPLAIADREGEAKLYMAVDDKNNPVANTLFESPGRRGVLVRLQTLDALAKMERLERIDHLKIDAEGAELLILKGGGRSLGRTRRIIMEIHRSLVDGQAVRAELEKHGFRLKTLCDEPFIVEGVRPGW